MFDGIANFLIAAIRSFAGRPADEQMKDAITYVQWVIGFILLLAALFFYLVRRAKRGAIEFAKERQSLVDRIDILQKANAELSTEKSRLAAEFARRCPSQIAALMAKERAEGNRDVAVSHAMGFLDAGREGLAQIYRSLADASLARIEDGAVALEEARLQAMGWLAADPQSPEARKRLNEIEARLSPSQAVPDIDDDAEYAELRRFLRNDPLDALALVAAALKEFDAGHYRIAALVYERALASVQRETGGDSPEAAKVQILLGRALTFAGEYGDASKHVAMLDRYFARHDSPDMELVSGFEVLRAALLIETGQLAEAFRAIGKAIPQCLERLGDTHENVLNLQYYNARALEKRGQTVEVEAAARALLPLMEKIKGSGHHDTLSTRILIASCLRDRGQTAEAEAAAREVLSLEEKINGPEHPSTLTTAMLLATCEIDLDLTVEAKQRLALVLDRAAAVFGSANRSTGHAHFQMARCLDAMGEYDAANGHLDQASTILAQAVLPQHPDRREFDAYIAERQARSSPSDPGSPLKPLRPKRAAPQRQTAIRPARLKG